MRLGPIKVDFGPIHVDLTQAQVEATVSTLTGAGAGVVAANTIGRIGIAAMGSAIGVGAGPIIAAGSIVGLAAYGAKKAIDG